MFLKSFFDEGKSWPLLSGVVDSTHTHIRMSRALHSPCSRPLFKKVFFYATYSENLEHLCLVIPSTRAVIFMEGM